MTRSVLSTPAPSISERASRVLLTLTCFSIAAAAVAVSVQLGFTTDTDFGVFRLRVTDATRPLVAGFIAAAVLLAKTRGSRAWTRIAQSLLVLLAVLALTVVASTGANTWSVGDGAMIELYTLYAGQGRQLLGPGTRRYGWHHPGPLMFYLLAPIAGLSGQTGLGVNVGAIVLNLASLALIAWIMTRNASDRRLPLMVAVFVVLYLVRVPSLLASAWNPHLTVLPFAALVLLTAASVAGDLVALPAVAFLASFVVQSHVGYAPVALALSSLSMAATLVLIVRDSARRWARLWSLAAAIQVLQLVWLLPFAEQMTGQPGNMTRIWRFFFESGVGQDWSTAAYAWSGMLLGVFRPQFRMAVGHPFWGTASAWVVIAAAALASAPAVLAWLAWRRRLLFAAGLNLACAVAAAAGAWSTLHVRGQIGDYHIFWLSILGVIDLACIAAAGAEVLSRRVSEWTLRLPTPSMSGLALVAGVALMACVPFVRSARTRQLGAEERIINHLVTPFLFAMPQTGNHNPHVRFGPAMWSQETGIILQLSKAGVDFTLEPRMMSFFGTHRAQNGHEDALVDVVKKDRHQELLKRPGNVVLAHDAQSGIYIDEISLVDFPAYRTWSEPGREK